MPPVTLALIVANVAGFLLQGAVPGIVGPFALWPLGSGAATGGQVSFAPWQLVTYAFLHGGLLHLGFNMLALYMFGSAIERVFNERRYLLYYFVCVIAAGFTQLGFAAMTNEIYPTIGASGGVFGLLLAYAIYFPHNRVMLLFPPIPMPAWLLVTLYGLFELYLGATGSPDGVAHFAHLGGAAAGFLLILYWRRGTLRRP